MRRVCIVLGIGLASAGLGQTQSAEVWQGGALSVQQAVAIALRDNPQAHAIRAEARAAAADIRFARSQTRPQVSANTYLTYGDMPAVLYSVGGVMPGSLIVAPSQGLVDQNLTLMVPLYTGDRLRAQVRATQARAQAAMAILRQTEAEIALQVREAYYRALWEAENVRAAQAQREATLAMARVTQALWEAGKGLEASVRRVEAEQAATQRDLTAARNEEAKALLDLRIAMGVRPDVPLSLSEPLVFTPPAKDLNGYLQAAAENRPELQAARLLLTAAGHQLRSARGAQSPQVYGMAMADGFLSNRMGTRGGYNVGVILSLPLLDAGERRAGIDRAEALQARAAADLHRLQLQVETEVRRAWLDVEAAAQNYRAAQEALRAAQVAYDVAALRVENQRGLLVEQLDALAVLTRARRDVARALHDHAVAVARLQRAAGLP
ncbi:MAG: TolC family protein [Chloroherpetonaceae bacterium]|nr:TolC family protein [Chthonomonadaceae bacterium]MDW8207441.1 TolC family protein [Chloroherpetonaceae bacterium]